MENDISEFISMDYAENKYVVGYKERISSKKNGIVLFDAEFKRIGGVCRYFSNVLMVKTCFNGFIGAGTDGNLIFSCFDDF